ncbi:T6SS immunity protein Tdi1 domain-containing protein [Sphingopyxis macrogoltabida]|nr:T6SS immunity protein Tdi1 domain-containing protein [Sphingopyxis macrogoltabida]ALJ12535.1 hypothetical protein LH19_06620 [Sphingopyxis macrogoltabida]
MTVTLNDIAFQLEQSVAQAATTEWSWLVPEPWTPLVCSMVGGVFFEKPNESIHWLDTGTGLVEQVAKNRVEFEEVMKTSPALTDEWFLPSLIERLHAAGKKPGAGECYGFSVLPVFAEGKYEVGNMFVVPVWEQFVGMADVHRQISELPEGASVQVKIID